MSLTKSVNLPSVVNLERQFESEYVTVNGPKGKVDVFVSRLVIIQAVDDNKIDIVLDSEMGSYHHMSNPKALLGTTLSKLSKAIEGVTQGLILQLNLVGVGYRALIENGFLVLKLGYSHDIIITIPDGIQLDIIKRTLINLRGVDYEMLTKFASKIRSYRLPEPYKGKGVFYKNEIIQLKEGKKN